jgi:dolichol-phosphate mannosyltransferase
MRQVDLILPVYREAEGISHFDARLRRVLSELSPPYRFRLYYILDRSPDRSYEILREIALSHDDTVLIHLSSRFGHQASLMAGLDHSAGDAAIMMDTDLQHPPELIPSLLDRFEAGCDVVQAVRCYGDSISVPRRLASALFYRIQNALSPVKLDPGCADFRLISRKVVSVLQQQIREHNPFLRLLVAWTGFRTATVPFVAAPRAHGSTQYSLRRLAGFFLDGILSFSRIPLRLAAILGFMVAAAGLFYAAVLLYTYWRYQDFPRGYASLISVVLVLGGVQLVILGILGEYIGHILDEVKARPLYIVDEIIVKGQTPVAGQHVQGGAAQ